MAVEGRCRVMPNQNPEPRYWPLRDDTAASISEDGVSEERVISAEAALRMEGDGCDGAGGGGAGTMVIESIFRGVDEKSAVRVALVVFGGRVLR